MTNNKDIFLLAIRGSLVPTQLDEARTVHNHTAGHPEGVAAARALGDLSHNVFVPLADAPGAATELLILDTWNSLEGLGRFFADPNVQAGAGQMFKTRDPAVFSAADAYSFSLASPRSKPDRFVGMIRGTVRARAEALEVFDRAARASVNQSRMKGHASHHLFWRIAQPGEPETLDLLGLDLWHDVDGMRAWYGESTGDLKRVFAAPPATSVWKQPAGSWVEW